MVIPLRFSSGLPLGVLTFRAKAMGPASVLMMSEDPRLPNSKGEKYARPGLRAPRSARMEDLSSKNALPSPPTREEQFTTKSARGTLRFPMV